MSTGAQRQRLALTSGRRGRLRQHYCGRRGAVLALALLFAVSPLSPDMTAGSGGDTPQVLKSAQARGGGGNGGGGGGNGGGSGNSGGKGNTGGGTSGGGAGGGTGTTSGTIREPGSGGKDDAPPVVGIVLAQFTTAIRKRVPADEVVVLEDSRKPVSFYTEARGMTGQTLMHRWRYGGKVQQEVAFNIRGKVWRFWSTQLLPPDKPGDWEVQVIDGNGAVLESRSLTFKPAT